MQNAYNVCCSRSPGMVAYLWKRRTHRDIRKGICSMPPPISHWMLTRNDCSGTLAGGCASPVTDLIASFRADFTQCHSKIGLIKNG